jgi:hypothetical protein
MPFKKVAANVYKSPSGKTWTKKQVTAYYATEGFTKPVRGVAGPKRGSK